MSKIIKKVDKSFLTVFSLWLITTITCGHLYWLSVLTGMIGISYIIWQVMKK